MQRPKKRDDEPRSQQHIPSEHQIERGRKQILSHFLSRHRDGLKKMDGSHLFRPDLALHQAYSWSFRRIHHHQLISTMENGWARRTATTEVCPRDPVKN